jgi:hypothetical protein
MDINVIRFLESLGGLGSTVNAVDIINEVFPIPINASREDFNTEKERISDFLNRLRFGSYIYFNEYHLVRLGNYEGSPKQWFDRGIFEVSILPTGLQYLADERAKKIESDANQSAINTNNSIIATNTSVQITNTAIINLATIQSDILRRQTLIFLFTAIFALGALIVAVIGLVRDGSKEQLQKQLQDKSKEIQSLHIQLSQLKNDSSRLSMAKKTLPKNH